MPRLARAASLLLLSIALAPLAAAGEIFVNDDALAGGDGTTLATAYQTVHDAVNDANARTEASTTIHIAEGTYFEAPNALTITREGIRLIGSTVLTLDARGLPTGQVATASTLMRIPGAPAPQGSALVRIHASNTVVTRLVVDGGIERPPPAPGGGLTLIRSDGAVAGHQLEGVRIHDNCIQDSSQGLFLRLTSAALYGNFVGRNFAGMVCVGGFAQSDAHPGPEQCVIFAENRVADNWNYGTNFLGMPGSLLAPTFASLGLADGPGANHIVVVNNDYVGNGDARTPIPPSVVNYPQPIQYAGLLFNPMSNDASDATLTTRVEALIAWNTFNRNGYGWSASTRVALNAAQTAYSVDLRLIGNRYCGNAFNSAFVNFGLNSQSHGGAGGGAQFRYAQGTIYTIDATCDDALESALDNDNPETDPRLPAVGPLSNVLIFNGQVIPPGVKITKPPIVSPGPPIVYAAPVTIPDTTAPEIERTLALPPILWPANGRMRPVWIAVGTEDACDPRPTCAIESVTSNQAAGGAEPDWEITGPLTLKLRAERSGWQSRIYTITVRCADAAGNVSTGDVRVIVP